MGPDDVRRDDGFSLVEMMTVVLILGMLVSVAVASYLITTDRTYRIACLSNQNAIRHGIIQYEASNGARPEQLQDLVTDGFIKDPDDFGHCPADPEGTAYVYDPASGDVSCPRHPVGP
jgi:prepilin-type N-terminal cleavage/methylation domain-containing protein